jgi:hypothetical protein
MARMDFFGNQISAPEWMGDFGSRDHLMPWPAKLDATQFKDANAVLIVPTAPNSAADTTITATAITTPLTAALTALGSTSRILRAGQIIDFGGAKFARLSQDVNLGDTTIHVDALPTALIVGDVGRVSAGVVEFIPSGTPVGRTFAERDANTAFGAAAITDDEIFLTAFDCPNALVNNDIELYRHHSVVKENYLPGYAAYAAGLGIADPTVAPTLGHTGSDGPATAGLKYVGYSFFNANGETKISPLASVTTLTTEHISVADIAFPAGTLGIKFYASPAINDPGVTFVKALAAHAATTLLTDGIGSAPKGSNGTAGAGAILAKLRTIYECEKGVD